MKYLWTEDSGAGFDFWNHVNRLCFNNSLIVESKLSNQGLIDAVKEISESGIQNGDIYYVAFDYVTDNQDIRNKYRELNNQANKHKDQIIVLDVICFEYFIFAFEYLVGWTGSRKSAVISLREDILNAIEDHHINFQKIKSNKTLKVLSQFKKFSTEHVLKSLVSELTENERWSVKGREMGECWWKDCCIADKTHLRCGHPHESIGDNKMKLLIESNAVKQTLSSINNTQNTFNDIATKSSIF